MVLFPGVFPPYLYLYYSQVQSFRLFLYYKQGVNERQILKQQLQFTLSQKLSPQQIQLMKLIQLPTLAFEQRLKQEIEENPALESGKEEEANYEDDINDSYDELY